MGLRFRKSVKFGPFRLNFSKSGVGYSYGVKGCRVTHKATGGVRTTASIPGTGISYVTETGAKKAQNEKRSYSKPDIKFQEATAVTERPEGRCVQMTGKDGKPYYIRYIKCPYCNEEVLETAVKCPYCNKTLNASKKSGGGLGKKIGAVALAGVVAVGGIGMLGGDDEPAPEPDPAPIVQIADPAPEPEPEPEPVVDETPVIAEPEPEPEPEPVPVPEPTPALAPVVTPEPAPEPEVIAPVTPEPEQPAEKKEYVGNKNSKVFHETWCDSVERMKDKNKVQLFGREDSIAAGFDPCENCTP